MITKIEKIWADFELKDCDKSGIVLKRYSPDIKPDCFVSMRMPEKVRSIAFKLSSTNINIQIFNDLRDITSEIIPDETNPNKSLLLISLADNNLISIFAVLCEDFFQAVSEIIEEETLIQILKNRFTKWKELFILAKSPGLPPEKQIGLFGELFLIKLLIQETTNIEHCLSIWTGPETGIRDFEINRTAIEVKTTQTHNHQKIGISSERQLDTTLLSNLFLFHLSLEKRNGSDYTLNSIVEEVFKLIGDNALLYNTFKRKLTNVGYFEHHKVKYQDISYFVRDEDFYLVKDNFPRIEENQLMKGVGDVRYSIVLSSETEHFKSDVNTVIQNIV
jgi:hypothetical protein